MMMMAFYEPGQAEERFLVARPDGYVVVMTVAEIGERVHDQYWYEEGLWNSPISIWWWDPSYGGPRRVYMIIEPPAVKIVIYFDHEPHTVASDNTALTGMDFVKTGDPHVPWQRVR